MKEEKDKSLKDCNSLEIANLLDITLKCFACSDALMPHMLPIPLDIEDKRRLCLMLEACECVSKMQHRFNNNPTPTVFGDLFVITPKGILFYTMNSFTSEYYKNEKALKEDSFKAKKVRWELCISILSLILSIIVFLDNAKIISFHFY